MQITDLPFGTTDWAAIEPTEHPGEVGTARWRTCTFGPIRVRMVEYSLGYRADHHAEPHRSSSATGATLFIVD